MFSSKEMLTRVSFRTNSRFVSKKLVYSIGIFKTVSQI